MNSVSAPLSFSSQARLLRGVLLVTLFVVGVFLRLPPTLFHSAPLSTLSILHPQPKFTGVGVDERLYRNYVDELRKVGVLAYPEITKKYIERQKTGSAFLPPLRVSYILAGYYWQWLFGGESLGSLRNVSALASIFTLAITAVFASRIASASSALAITALMVFAPTQIHMSQHALIDGFFTLWAVLALWSLWECLRRPSARSWLVGYACSLAALVLTKENAVFVWSGIVAIIVANIWLRAGVVGPALLLATVLGPFAGVLGLAWFAGGVSSLVSAYHLFFTKSLELQYAILKQDGPWDRYLLDVLLVSPVVFLLAIGSAANLTACKKVEWFFFIFITVTYVAMSSVRYGLNLRFGNIWDFPLRVLAVSQLFALTAIVIRWRNMIVIIAIAVICAAEFRNYIILAVRYPLYDLVTTDLTRALKIRKLAGDLPNR